MRYGGLDVSKTRTGWGLAAPGDARSGAFSCPVRRPFELNAGVLDAGYAGDVADWFSQVVDAWLVAEKPDRVAIEQPIPGSQSRVKTEVDLTSEWAGKAVRKVQVGGTSIDVTHFLHGLALEAARLCRKRSIPAIYVNSATWRKAMSVGQPPKGSKDRSAWYKARAREICAARGVTATNGDAAEGMLIAFYLMEQAEPDDLFRRTVLGRL